MGNVSKKYSAGNMKKTQLYGYVYDFSINYDSTDIDDILNVYKYVMVKSNIK